MSLTKRDRKEELIDLITLASIEGVGVNRLYQLTDASGSAGKALSCSISDLTDIPTIGREIASRIKENQNREKACQVVEEIIKRQWGFYLFNDPDYPSPLKNIADRPPYLFYLGDYREADTNAIAIVGSRTASEEGRLFAENLASALAENSVTVVSGMARGIDLSAHRGVLKTGGRTIAVFGSSLDIIYPPEGKETARKIVESGAIFSELLPGTMPYGPNFPKRNRIISGLSQGVVVIEAAERSGALSTAGHALIQNREVFAVPGSPRSEMSRGTNKLIKEGAKLLTSIEDIFVELPRLKGRVTVEQVRKMDDLTATEQKIIQLFAEGPLQIDILSRRLNTPVPDLLQVLLALELKGIIKELSGKRYILN
jgi:DNA processing protein